MPEPPEYYNLKISGLSRRLPVVRISEDLSIASFVMLGDTELVEACARDITNHPGFPTEKIELLVCPEAKAVPLTHAIARNLNLDYVVARKQKKAYMENLISVELQSITTKEKQKIVLDGRDASQLNGRRVAVIDDVISTGGSLTALLELLSGTGCEVVSTAAVLLEDGGYSSDSLLFLGRLPVFPG